MRRIVSLLLLAALILPLAEPPAQSQARREIVIGSKKFTESVLLGEVLVDLADEAGRTARHQDQLGGSRILWEALLSGSIDAYPEYTGTIRQVLLRRDGINSFEALREALNKRGIGITEPLGFNNTYALAMKQSKARKLGIQTISDLADHLNLTFGFTNEFMDRSDGWPGLRREYELPQDDVQGLDHDLAYQGLQSGDIDVIDAYTTDPQIEYYDLKLLEDDRSYFPTYEAVILYRTSLERTAPDVVSNFRRLEGTLSAREMSRYNGMVQLKDRSSDQVAARLLKEELGLDTSFTVETFWSRLLNRTTEHLYLVGVSLLVAILVSVPLGILAVYNRYLGQFILGAVGILQTIPSLALLVFMIPLFGIGTRPALVALFVYSLLPIVRNTHAGLTDIDRDVLESARALGMHPFSILYRVKLPLAMRSILAGIKTSAVINVGVATLGALIGAGGYGQPILTGIRLDDMILVLEGAVPAALLALVVQWLLDLTGWFLIPKGLQIMDQ